MKEIYLISSPIKIPTNSSWALFHFRGYYLGHKINEIAVHSKNIQFEFNDEYLMKLEVLSLKRARLITHLLEAKNLKNLNFNF